LKLLIEIGNSVLFGAIFKLAYLNVKLVNI